MIKILLLIDYNKESERRVLNGLIRYADMHGGCEFVPMTSFDLETPGHSAQIAEAARAYGVDAIFGVWKDIDVPLALSLGVPIFIRMRHDDYDCFHMLSGPYRQIGEMAARYFLRQYCPNYAFLGLEGLLWSEERFEGYRDCLLESGEFPHVFRSSGNADDWDSLTQWISSLPKPVALFACNDATARRATEACRYLGIEVPLSVAVLGVDDDEFLCSFSQPSISSIKLDYEKQGEMLGEAIFSRVGKGGEANADPLHINIRPVGIVERRSTVPRRVSDPVVRTVLDYFDDNFDTPFSLREFLSTIPLSRRSVEMRFRREMAPLTMMSYLTGLRVRKMCRLLSRGDLSVGAAASLSGFGDSTNVARAFRSVTGLSPREYIGSGCRDAREPFSPAPSVPVSPGTKR